MVCHASSLPGIMMIVAAIAGVHYLCFLLLPVV